MREYVKETDVIITGLTRKIRFKSSNISQRCDELQKHFLNGINRFFSSEQLKWIQLFICHGVEPFGSENATLKKRWKGNIK